MMKRIKELTCGACLVMACIPITQAAITNNPHTTDCCGSIVTNGTLSMISAIGQPGGYTRTTNGTLTHIAGFLGAPFPTPKPQSISFPAIADQETTNTVGLTATASSGLTVSFAVGSGYGSISEGTNLTFTGAGMVSVIASQAGNHEYLIAPSVTNSFNVTKAKAPVTLSNTNKTFDGSEQSPTITTVPGGLSTTTTYDGGTVAPSNAGAYVVVATINDLMYHGATTGTMTIARAIDPISFSSTNQVYDGTPRTVGVSTPNSQSVTCSYDGNTIAPSNAGVYSVTGVVNTANWAGTNTTELTISKSTQVISFATISDQKTTNAMGLAAAATSTLPVSFAVDSGPANIAGGTNLTFTTAGSVSIIASQGGDSNWEAAPDVTNTFNVTRAVASVTLTELSKVYNGAGQTAGSTTVPNGLTVDLTYDGSVSGPTNAGTYELIGLVNDLMYQGGATNSMIIERASDTITFGNTNQTFNGSPRFVTSNSANAQPIEITYAGSTTAPSNAGTYAVTGVVDSVNWAGTNTTELIIGKAEQALTFSAIADQDVTNEFGLAATASSALSVSFAVFSGPGNIASGTNLSFDATGTVLVTADQTGDANFIPAPTVTNSITVNPVLAAINTPLASNIFETTAVLGAHITATNHVIASERGIFWGTSNTFTVSTATRVSEAGSFGEGMYSVTASNLPAGVTNFFRGFVVNAAGTNMTAISEFLTRPAAPEPLTATNREAYGFHANWNASIGTTNYWFDLTNSAGYVGSYSNFLVGNKTTLSVTGLLPGVLYAYRLRAENATGISTNSGWQAERAAAGVIELTPITMSYTGTYASANPSEQNWVISNSGNCEITYTNTITYSPGAASWLTAAAYGSLLTNTMTTWTGSVDLAGINAGIWYATNSMSAPTATNSPQAVVIELTVHKSDQAVNLPFIGDQLTTNEVGLAATSSSGLPVSFSVESGPAIISSGTNLSFNATGIVTIVATQMGNSNYNATATSNAFTVTKAVAGLTLENLNQTYDGSQRIVTGSTIPTGLTVDVTYDASSTAPTNAGSYTVIGTVNDIMYQGGATDILVVAKANQSITFPAIAQQDSTNRVGLTASASSGGVVEFTVLSGPGQIASSTNLSFIASGIVQIITDQSGDSNFNPAPTVTNAITVNKSAQSALIFDPATPQVYLTTNRLTTSGGLGTGAVTYVVTDGPGVITGGDGLYVNSGSGVVTLVASKAWDDIYRATASTSLVLCAHAEQTIAFPTVSDQKVTNRVGLTATASSDLSVVFSVFSGPGIITDGTNLAFNAPGNVLITADQTGNTNYNAAPTVTNTVRVGPVLAEISSPSFSNLFETAATLGANIIATNHVSVTERGIFWGTSNTFEISTATRVSETGLFGMGTYSLLITNLPSGVTNYFRGFAVNSAGTNMTAVNEFLTRAAAPQPLPATSLQAYSFSANWATATGATNYWFDMTNRSGYVGSYSNLSVGNQTTLAVTGLQPGVTYSYRLRSENATGISTNSGWLNNMSAAGVITLTPATMNYTGTYVGTNPVTQTWTIRNSGNCSITYTNAITYGEGADNWLSAPACGALTTGSMHSWTGLVDIAGINAGTWYATNMLSAPTATNSPQHVTVILNVLRADQTISFPPLANQDLTNTIGLAATSGSGLPVVFSIASGPGVIFSETNLSFNATGIVQIVASQAGNTNWNPASSITNTLQVFPVLPQVSTRTQLTTSHTQIESGGEVTYDGGAPITQRGLCWSTTSTPTTSDSITYDGTGTGFFTSVARGLDAETTYYLRAYAINEVGTTYGHEVVSITSNTPPAPPPAYSWTGHSDTFWANRDNWIGGIPTHSNTAIFTAPNASNATAMLMGDRSVAGLLVSTDCEGPMMLAMGNLLLTNDNALVDIRKGTPMLTGSITLGPNALVTNAPEAGLYAIGGTHSHGHLNIYAGENYAFGRTNCADGDIDLHAGQALIMGEMHFSSTSRLHAHAGSTVRPYAMYAGITNAIRITNATPGTVAASINGTLRIELYGNDCEKLDLDENQLVLGSNSVLDVHATENNLSITSRYTIATYSNCVGAFGEIKGVTAHTINYGTNAITLNPTFVWSGSHNTNWSENLNWTNSAGSLPGEHNDAGFIAAANTNIVVNLDTNPVVRSIRALGSGTVTLDGAHRTITLTNRDVRSGESPAIQADETDLEILSNIQTVPGARITSMGNSPASVRLLQTIACLSGSGNLIFDGNQSILLGGTLSFHSSSNAVEIRGCTLHIGSDTNLGTTGNALLITEGGTLVTTNSLQLGRRIELNNGANIEVGHTNILCFTNTISGNSPLSFAGTGTIILEAPVAAGRLSVTQSLFRANTSVTTTDDLNILHSARLGGCGPIRFSASTHQLRIHHGARCAPGSSIGTLTVDGSMTLDGSLDIEIENSSNDVLIVRDTLTIAPSATLVLTGVVDGVSDYRFATFASRSGQFLSPSLPAFYTLTQSATDMVLSARSNVELATTNIARTGEAVHIDLNISSNTSWTATSTSSWITVTSGTAGTGNGTVILDIAENNKSQRKGTVWIAGMKYVVTQFARKAVYLDFDGDSLADKTVYWPAAGYWYILQSSSRTGCIQPWGWSAADPVPGDYNGDGKYDAAVYLAETGAWYIREGCDGAGGLSKWGFEGCIPVPADYDNDGITDIAVYSPEYATWYIWESATETVRIQPWGFHGAIPVRGDFDGDARDDIALYHPGEGMWYILLSSTGELRLQAWGWSESEAVPGDYDGDRITDIATYWPETGCWNILQSSDKSARCEYWGWKAAYPVPADYDGDRKWDVSTYWPEGGMWYIWQSKTAMPQVQPWGCEQYVPVY